MWTLLAGTHLLIYLNLKVLRVERAPLVPASQLWCLGDLAFALDTLAHLFGSITQRYSCLTRKS